MKPGNIEDAPLKVLNKLFLDVVHQLQQSGFTIEPFESAVVVDKRATVRLGSCKKLSNGLYRVGISKWVLEKEEDALIANVIAHEACHLVKGAMNHGPMWKKAAGVLNQRGYSITSTFKEIEESRYPYVIQCDSCGMQIHRMRMSKLVKYPEKYRCGKCHGTLRRMKKTRF